MLKTLFWSSIALLVYVYIGYPLLIAWIAGRRPRPAGPELNRQAGELPLVSVIIPAYNEERWIERKIENTLTLDYPHNRMQILVASDGSTDRTVEIARRFSSQGVEVVHAPERAGKMATLNRVVTCARGDILLFTDASALLAPDALRWLAPHFHDPQVGCVSGDLVCLATSSSATEGEELYWRYEAWIKRSESRFHSCLGAHGQIFAARRSLVPQIPGASDDFYIPMRILISTGARIVFEPRAKAWIPAAATLRQEFRRKVRSHAALFWDLPHLRKGLNPWTSDIWWQCWSHHVLRLIVPWAMLAALAVSPWLPKAGMIYRLVFYGQVLFYLAAAAGLLLIRRGIHWKPFYGCFYFVFANLAVALAWLRWLQGKQPSAWQRTDRILPLSTGQYPHGL